MPIKPENKHRYPADWKEVRKRILARARYRCEWPGCGVRHHSVGEWHQSPGGLWAFTPTGGNRDCDRAGRGELSYRDAAQLVAHNNAWCNRERLTVIVLTIAHLDHTPENCADDNLRAWCQRHHLGYDAEHHRQTAYMTRRAAARTRELFPLPSPIPGQGARP